MQRGTTYAVEIAGRLPSALALELDGFAHQMSGSITVLIGNVADVAALYGLLARLESLGVTLISVQPVSDHTETD
jgi:hypothetical protein